MSQGAPGNSVEVSVEFDTVHSAQVPQLGMENGLCTSPEHALIHMINVSKGHNNIRAVLLEAMKLTTSLHFHGF